ncbi:pyrimidine 5'-nucleotidase [Paracoccus seriniphilus]|uniref:Putative hydrolase of the HAD superfamily n=1 Tax=Paracoccus seriniphilus TaxID=184748 RepID=A0A239PN18_9RHOB|nr:pyrimidine 5'-nucleotidase [Paracoccus seriniphilus]WCR13661.1 pyrimidine 5'-nucleotidase [Paracoccus seriniphilus]SNT68743.1 putative hydrolase of the HAD superfamily [Paracoccus seriniphilus]
MDFSNIDAWIFDLDNTLYPPEMALFPQIEARMTRYVMRLLRVEPQDADRLRRDYWRQHGTTLAGLMAEHAIDPVAYLDEVHDIDFTPLVPAPELAAVISALPGRKLIHTNGDSRYARKVLAARGLDLFEEIYGVEETGFHPKPDERAYAAVLRQSGVDPGRAAMFEDDPRNLIVPHALGMRTVLIGRGHSGPDVTGDGNAQPEQDLAHVMYRSDDLFAFLSAIALEG